MLQTLCYLPVSCEEPYGNHIPTADDCVKCVITKMCFKKVVNEIGGKKVTLETIQVNSRSVRCEVYQFLNSR